MRFSRPVLVFSIFVLIFVRAFPGNCDSLREQLRLAKGAKRADLLVGLSNAIRSDSVEAAACYASQALELARQLKDVQRQVNSGVSLSKALIVGEKFPEAEKVLTASLQLRNWFADSTQLLPLYYQFSYLYIQQNEYRKSLAYISLARAILKAAGKPDPPNILQLLGGCWKGLGDNNLAVSYFKEAIQIYQRKGNDNACVSVYFSLGMIYSEWGWYDKALKSYDQALRIQIRKNDSVAAAYTLMNIAGIYQSELGYEKAFQYTRQAYRIFCRLNIPRGIGYSLNGLGSCYAAVDLSDSAIAAYSQAVQQYQKVEYPEGLAFVNSNIGSVYVKKKNYTLALEYFQRALSFAMKLDSKIAECTTLASIGQLYLETGQITKAQDCFQQSLNIAVSRNFKEQMASNYLSLSEATRAQGKYSMAYEFLRMYCEVRDTLFREKSQKVVAEMEARYNLEQKEQQINLLIKENELNETEIANRKKFTITLVVVSLILILLLALLAWFYILKHRAYSNYIRLSLEEMKQENSEGIDFSGSDPEAPMQETPDGDLRDKEENSRRLISALNRLITEEQIYLNPELTLADAARRLNTNTTYLSKAINEELKKNFSTFINEHRIRKAQKMLAGRESATMSIEGIALSVGFNSKSSFNSAFKKYSGVTPSFFQRSARRLESGSD